MRGFLPFGILVRVGVLAVVLSSCFQAPVKGGGSTKITRAISSDVGNEPEKRQVSTFDPNASEPQVIAATSVAELSGTSVTLSPGAFSVPTNIVIEQGQPLQETNIMQELGLGESATVTKSAAAVIVRPDTDATLQKPMSLEIPLPSLGLWASFFMGDDYDKAAILYRVYQGDQGVVSGLIPRSQFNVDHGVARFETASFGSFQAVIFEQKVEKPIEVKSEEPIRNISNVPVVTQTGVVPAEQIVTKEATPPVTWVGIAGVVDSSTRNIHLTASYSGDFTLRNCRAMLRQVVTIPEAGEILTGSSLDVVIPASKETALTLFGRFQCVDNLDRTTESPWTTAIVVPEMILPAPVFDTVALIGAAADSYLNQTEIKTGSGGILNVTATGYATLSYSAPVRTSTVIPCDDKITYPVTTVPSASAFTGEDGDYVICVKATNRQGLSTYKSSGVLHKDTIAPIHGSLALGNEALDGYISATESAATNSLWILTANGYSEMAYSEALAVTGQNLVCDSSVTYGRVDIPTASQLPKSDGVYGLCVRMKDVAGNVTYAPSTTLIRQVNKPVFNSLGWGGPIADGFLNNTESLTSASLVGTLVGSAYVSAQYTVVAANQDCSLGSGWSSDVMANSSALSSDGQFKLCVRLTDSGSNITYGASGAFERDTVAPTPTLSGTPAASSNTTNLNVTVGGPGVIQYAFALLTGAADCTGATFPVWDPLSMAITASIGADGNKILCVLGKDAAGNISSSVSYTWVKDSVGPTFTSLASANESADGFISASEISSSLSLWTLTASGYTSASYSQMIAGNNFSCDNTQVYNLTAIPVINAVPAIDGSYSLCVKLQDAAGNTTYGQSSAVTRDTTPPAFTSLTYQSVALSDGLINASEAVTSSQPFSLVAANYTIASYSSYLLDGGLVCDGTQTYSQSSIPAVNTLGADGTYALCVKLIDQAGNIQYGKSLPLIKDTNLPTVTYTSTLPMAFSNVYPLPVSIGGDFTAYQYGINDNAIDCTGVVYGAWISAPTGVASFSAMLGADGLKTICVRGRDQALNEQAGATYYTWTLDTVAPTATFAGTPNAFDAATSLMVYVSGSGMSQYQYAIVSGSSCSGVTYGSWMSAPSEIFDSLGADGPMALCVIGKDQAENIQPSPTVYTWVKDTTAPLPGNLGNINTATFNDGSTVQLFWSNATDAGGVASYKIYHAPLGTSMNTLAIVEASTLDVTISYPASMTTITSGFTPNTAYTFNIVATDLAGNRNLYNPVDTGYLQMNPLPNNGTIGFNTSKILTLTGQCAPVGATITINGSTSATGSCSGSTFSIPVNISNVADGALTFNGTLSANGGSIMATATITGLKNTQVSTGLKFNSPNQNYRVTPNGQYGTSVALSPDGLTMAVGAPFEPYDGANSNFVKDAGAVYIYTRPDPYSNWALQQKVLANGVNARMPGDQFGMSIDLSADTLAVGAPFQDFNETGTSILTDAGAVFIFTSVGGVWNLQQKLVGTGTNGRILNSRLGQSVALDGDTVVAGSPYHGFDAAGVSNVANAGAAYVFVRTAGVWSQQQKLIPTGTNSRIANDYFGAAVDVSVDTIVVGAYNHGFDALGATTMTSAGAAFVFTRVAGVWSLQQKIVASGTNARVASDYFGQSVAVQGDQLLIGAPYQDTDAIGTTMGSNTGAAFYYTRSGSIWTQMQKLVASGTNARYGQDLFGIRVAINGTTALVGADGSSFDMNGTVPYLLNSGAAYFFTSTAGTWTQTQRVTPNFRSSNDYFGFSLSLVNNAAVVGAPLYNTDVYGANPVINGGAVMGYTYSGTWTSGQPVTGSLNLPLPTYNAQSGASVAISENDLVMVIGAPGDGFDEFGGNYLATAGAAYIYARPNITSPWTFEKKIVAQGANARISLDNFGKSIAVNFDGSIVAVGVPNHGYDTSGLSFLASAGAVYVYHRNGGAWNQNQKIIPPTLVRTANDQFGFSLAMNGTTLAIGAPYEDTDDTGANTLTDAGAVFMFEDNGSSYNQTKQIIAPSTNSGRLASDNFGYSVALNSGTLVVGAPAQDYDAIGATLLSNAGAAYVVRGALWDQFTKITPTGTNARAVSDGFGWSVATWGTAVVVGSPYHSADANGAAGPSGAGAAFVFRTSNFINWNQESIIVASGVNARAGSEFFGRDLGLNRDTLIVGAYGSSVDSNGGNISTSTGAAYIYTFNNSLWTLSKRVTAEFWPNGRVNSDFFATKVAIGTDVMAAGVPFHSFDSAGVNGSASTGAVFSFKRDP